MITDDPYGIHNLRVAAVGDRAAGKDPILTDTYLKVASREYGACQYCSLPECSPTSGRCMLRNLKRKTNPQGRIILENMCRRGASVEDIMDATGYTRETTLRYIQLWRGGFRKKTGADILAQEPMHAGLFREKLGT